MTKSRALLISLFALALPLLPCEGQLISTGIAAGTGFGDRGKTDGGSGNHLNLSLELKAPLLPGIRADGYLIDAPSGKGRVAASLSAVVSAPIPIITPYLIAGWGTYGIGGDSTNSGWNVGIGAKASVVIGPALFLEVRRHDNLARDIVTVGVRF